jgi:arabinogalactan oligomer / maltooligosaccharide transport system substrate-binding protein
MTRNRNKMRSKITNYQLPITDCRLRLTNSPVRFCLGLCLALALLVACNQSEPPPPPTPANTEAGQAAVENAPTAPQPAEPAATPTPEPSGRIVLWHSWAGADGDALAAILSAFRQRYPNITVDTLFVGYNDLPQSYTEAALAGGGPDVILSASWWLGDMAAADVVQPLNALVTPDELADFSPAALDHLRRQGQLYGLPTHVELVSLFYNRALTPAESLPTTTDALLALAQQNPQQGSGLYASLYHLYWGLPAYNAQLFDDGRVVLDANGGAADYLAWLATMNQSAGTFVDLDYGMLLDRFKKGEFAFFVDGPWAIDELRAALGDNLAVTTLPAGPAGPARPWLSADGVFLNPQISAEQQALALTFARFITSPTAGELLAQNARRLPANLAANIGGDPLLAGFLQQAANAEPMPAIPEMENVWGYGGDMIVKVLNGVGDPAAIVAETATLINEANGR